MSRITGSSGPWSQPDKVFLNAKNGESTTITKGSVVIWDPGADIDGFSVVNAAAANKVAGVAAEDIAAGEFGTIQTKGYCSYIRTSGTIAAGNYLIPGTAVATGNVAAATQLATGAVFAQAEANVTTNVWSGVLY